MNPSTLAIDAAGLDGLKRMAREQSPEALRRATQQFEAVFLQMVMKAMREATPEGGLMDSDTTHMYRDLLTSSCPSPVATRRGGTGGDDGKAARPGHGAVRSGCTAEIPGRCARYGGMAVGSAARPEALSYPVTATPDIAARALSDMDNPSAPPDGDGLPRQVRDFVGKVWPHAVDAARATASRPSS